jgi:hypothetical protein
VKTGGSNNNKHQIFSHVIILEKATTDYMWVYLNMWLEDKRKINVLITHTYFPLVGSGYRLQKQTGTILAFWHVPLHNWFLTQLQHVRNHLSSNTAAHPRRPDYNAVNTSKNSVTSEGN